MVEFLTRDHGRISAVARPPRSKKQTGAVLSFTPYLISWRGKSQLKTITALEPVNAGQPLLGKTLYCGFYLNEILLRALALEDECARIFDMYRQTVEALAESQSEAPKMEASLRNFELNLAQALGFGLDFEHDLDGRPIETTDDASYRLSNGESFVYVALLDKVPSDIYFSGGTLKNIAQRNFSSPDTLRAAKILCRQSLRPLIGERPLQSREFFK